ncbi:MAG: adenylate kinase [Bacilli bacterium]|nr:adenylate kinase [Bacilli bacterium]
MRNIIFIAPPAAGKGTQSTLIKEKYDLEHISTGDLLRAEVASGSALGNEVSEIINKGELVNDELMIKLLKSKIESLTDPKGIIFDGFPRTIHQAEMLDELMMSLESKIDYVIYLDIDKEVAMKRALGRITCPSCGAIFNIYTDTFNEENHCNKCGTELEKRQDDTEEKFINRFDNYIEKTKPLVEYYQAKGLLHNVKCCPNREDTFVQIEEVINEGEKYD